MTTEKIDRILRLFRRDQFDASVLLRQLRLSPRFQQVFGAVDVFEKVKTNETFYEEFKKLLNRNDEALRLIIEAARQVDANLADSIENQLNFNKIHRIGNFPTVIEQNYLAPPENEQIKAGIKEIWSSRQTGVLVIHGQNGIGKSTLMSSLMHDEDFFGSANNLPGLEAIVWFNAYQLCVDGKLKAKHFLRSLATLFQEDGKFIQPEQPLPTTFANLLGKICGNEQKLRFLLVIDDVLDRNFLEFACCLTPLMRCVVLSPKRRDLLTGDGDNFVYKSIMLEPSIQHVEKLFREKYQLPREISDDPDRMMSLLQLSYGLPLIASVIYKKFAGLRHQNRQIVENLLGKLEKNVASVEIQQDFSNIGKSTRLTIFSLFRRQFYALDLQNRRRYYAFLLLDPGQALHINLLTYIWQMDDINLTVPDAVGICDSYLESGLVRQIDMDVADLKKKEQFRQGYVVHTYLHQIALDDAISRSFATDLREARLKLVKKTVPLTSAGKDENILLLAAKLADWDLFKIIAEAVETATLMKLATTSSSSEQGGQNNVLKVLDSGIKNESCYETSWRCTHTFLTILNRLLTCGFEMQITKAVIDGEGIDLAKRDGAGMTLVMHACLRGYLPVIEWLIRRNPGRFDLDDKDNDGTTAAMFAAKWGHLEAVKWLAEEGADLSLGDNDGTTAMLYAAKWGHLNVVEWLHSHGLEAKLEVPNKNGETAVMLASWRGHFDIVKWLHSKGVDLSAKNVDGNTALSLAIDAASRSTFLREERQQIIDFLKSNKAK